MTKAFLETVVLKPENESLIKLAFSDNSRKKLKEFEKVAKKSFRRTTTQNKLSIKDLF